MKRPCLLFLGDSLIDYGNWSHRLPQYRAITSGRPGEQAEGLLWRLPVQSPVLPDAVVLMTGTNDLLFGDLDFGITIAQIIRELSTSFPQAEIIITSLLPYTIAIAGMADMVRQVNLALQEIAVQTGSLYFDLCSLFEQSTNTLFDYDGVHLSEAGYQLWSEELVRFLSSRLAKEPD